MRHRWYRCATSSRFFYCVTTQMLQALTRMATETSTSQAWGVRLQTTGLLPLWPGPGEDPSGPATIRPFVLGLDQTSEELCVQKGTCAGSESTLRYGFAMSVSPKSLLVQWESAVPCVILTFAPNVHQTLKLKLRAKQAGPPSILFKMALPHLQAVSMLPPSLPIQSQPSVKL